MYIIKSSNSNNLYTSAMDCQYGAPDSEIYYAPNHVYEDASCFSYVSRETYPSKGQGSSFTSEDASDITFSNNSSAQSRIHPVVIPPQLEDKIALTIEKFPTLASNSEDLSGLVSKLSSLEPSKAILEGIGATKEKTDNFYILNHRKDPATKNHIHIMQKYGKGTFKQNYRSLSLSEKKIRSISVVTLSTKATKALIQQEMAMNNLVAKIKGCVVPKEMIDLNIGDENAVALFSSFCDQGTMEETIRLSFANPPKLKELINEFSQLATILHTLHTEKHIIHGDLKADNVMYKTNQKTGEVFLKLIDFGVANIMGPDGITTGQRGPLAYVPPEATALFLLYQDRQKIQKQLIEVQKKTSPREEMQILETLLDQKNNEIKTASSKINYSLDVWMLGILMYKRAYGSNVPFILEYNTKLNANKDKPEELEKIKRETLSQLLAKGELISKPDPADSLRMLIWEMVNLDATQRPAMEDVIKRLSNIT